MPREPNAVDFWRGFALITIFINHVPGLYYTKFTHVNVSLSDSADLFVFLAGWSVRLLVGSGERKTSTRDVALRLGGRALELYAAQVLITMIAVAMLAATAIVLANPLLLEWHNAAAVFHDPVPTHIGLATLTHQLGYFDILPLYVVLMLTVPAFAVLDRYAPNLVLPVSLALYAVTLAFRLTLPTWPVPGTWFFNPLAWQLVFVLGFVLAKGDAGLGAVVRRYIFWIRIAAVPVVVLGALVAWFGWWPDPTKFPQPRLFFLIDKTFVTPVRLIQFLSLVAVFSLAFPYIRWLGQWAWTRWLMAPLIGLFAMLGRNSLYVFCVGSILSLAGQVARYVFRGTVGIDTAVVIFGIVIMAFTAWLAELRERGRKDRPARA
ncbi:MAG: OpgC family protein [Pseudolabrys sp.]